MYNFNYPTMHKGDKITLCDRTYVEALFEQQKLYNTGVETELLTRPNAKEQVLIVTRVLTLGSLKNRRTTKNEFSD